MDNNCVKYYPDPTCQWWIIAQKRILGMCALWPWRYDLGSRSWHTLGSWATIVWNIIQIGLVVTKLWPGHDVNRRTDRVIPITFFARGGGYNNYYNIIIIYVHEIKSALLHYKSIIILNNIQSWDFDISVLSNMYMLCSLTITFVKCTVTYKFISIWILLT